MDPKSAETDMSVRFKRMLRSDRERFWKKVREELVLDLVILTDDSCGRFRQRFPMLDVSARKDDSTILQFRDQLREFWRGDDPHGHALHSWVDRARVDSRQAWIISPLADGSHMVLPNYCLFSLSLAIAASELGPRMAVCANPKCPQKYFLKGRKTQQFCDRLNCAAFGQRQHKMKWWKAHKKELRARRKGSEMRPKKTGRN